MVQGRCRAVKAGPIHLLLKLQWLRCDDDDVLYDDGELHCAEGYDCKHDHDVNLYDSFPVFEDAGDDDADASIADYDANDDGTDIRHGDDAKAL